MSIFELEAAGGSAHFGTNDELRIKQTVDGIQYEYVYTNGEAILFFFGEHIYRSNNP